MPSQYTWIGSATIEMTTIRISHDAAIHPPSPSFRLLAPPRLAGAGEGAASAVVVSVTRSGMSDPRIEHRVEEVHEEVDEHEQDADDGDEALRRHVLPAEHGPHELEAHAVDAVDLLDDDGKLIGSTTDGPGALRSLTEAGINLCDRRVLFLGSGGAVRAVAFAVSEMTKASHVTILGRTRENVDELVSDLHEAGCRRVSGGSLKDDLRDAVASNDIIVQGTSVGMEPNQHDTCVPKDLLCPGQVVFDMVYRPHETRLLREAKEAGCAIVHGIDMLLYQAALQFERWTGTSCPIDAMRGAVSDLTGK